MKLGGALLIGIDGYSRPLRGCVNDIDAIEALLVARLGMPKERILRVESPASDEMRPGSMPATLSNLEQAFAALAERAEVGDRVFIYYSGHSTRTELLDEAGNVSFRGGLVPVDFDATAERRYLQHHDLDRLLSNIVARGCSVTFMLDCAHAAAIAPGWVLTDSPRWRALLSGLGNWPGQELATVANDCQIVAACLDHETCREFTTESGARHGVFTHSFLRALDSIPGAELSAVRWSMIWQRVCADVAKQNPFQQPWMSGDLSRGIFTGRSIPHEAGFSIRGADDGYEIGAGTLASVTESALVAVYGDATAQFPPRDSPEDREARLGVLRVTRADRSSASAVAQGPRFEVPPGARGRLIESGSAARLRCALIPPDARLATILQASRLVELVDPGAADVHLQRVDDSWLLSDPLHEPDPASALVVLKEHELPQAREVLERYGSYSLPWRLARLARDLPSKLDVALLLCQGELSAAAAERASLPEASWNDGYELPAGARVCLRVRNRSSRRLRVTVLNAAASGTVQILREQVLAPGGASVWWAGGKPGRPFVMTLPAGKQEGLDCLVAVGTTLLAGYPGRVVDADAADAEGIGVHRKALAEEWTATQVIVRTTASAASPWASVRAASWWPPPSPTR